MLILTRREGESVRIGEGITVTVLRVKGSQVRLGVNAPKDVAVQREEIADRLRTDAADATDTAGAASAHAVASAAAPGSAVAETPPR